jgi:hypothetical protein
MTGIFTAKQTTDLSQQQKKGSVMSMSDASGDN